MLLGLIKSCCLLQGSRAKELRGCILPSPLPSCHALNWGCSPHTQSIPHGCVHSRQILCGCSSLPYSCDKYGRHTVKGSRRQLSVWTLPGKALPGPHLTLELQLFKEEVMMSFEVVIWRMERYLRHSPGEEIRKGGGGDFLCPATLPRSLYHKHYSNTWWRVGVMRTLGARHQILREKIWRGWRDGPAPKSPGYSSRQC